MEAAIRAQAAPVLHTHRYGYQRFESSREGGRGCARWHYMHTVDYLSPSRDPFKLRTRIELRTCYPVLWR